MKFFISTWPSPTIQYKNEYDVDLYNWYINETGGLIIQTKEYGTPVEAFAAGSNWRVWTER